MFVGLRMCGREVMYGIVWVFMSVLECVCTCESVREWISVRLRVWMDFRVYISVVKLVCAIGTFVWIYCFLKCLVFTCMLPKRASCHSMCLRFRADSGRKPLYIHQNNFYTTGKGLIVIATTLEGKYVERYAEAQAAKQEILKVYELLLGKCNGLGNTFSKLRILRRSQNSKPCYSSYVVMNLAIERLS